MVCLVLYSWWWHLEKQKKQRREGMICSKGSSLVQSGRCGMKSVLIIWYVFCHVSSPGAWLVDLSVKQNKIFDKFTRTSKKLSLSLFFWGFIGQMINPEKNCHGNRLLKMLLVVAPLVIRDLLLQFGPHVAKVNYFHSSQQQGHARRCAQTNYT